MMNPFKKTAQAKSQIKKAESPVEDVNSFVVGRVPVDSPRDPTMVLKGSTVEELTAIEEGSLPHSLTHSVSLSLSQSPLQSHSHTPSPSPIESRLSIISALDSSAEGFHKLFDSSSEELIAPRSAQFNMTSTRLALLREHQEEDHDDDYDVEIIDSPTSFMLNTDASDFPEDAFRGMTPADPSLSDGSLSQDPPPGNINDISLHRVPLSPVSAMIQQSQANAQSPRSLFTNNDREALLSAAVHSNDVPSSPTRAPINPMIALSNDQLDRQILSTIQDEEPTTAIALERSNAILKRKSTSDTIKDFEKRLLRSKSVSKPYGSRSKKDGSSNTPPLLFSQSTGSISRSKSLNTVKRSNLIHEVTLDDVAPFTAHDSKRPSFDLEAVSNTASVGTKFSVRKIDTVELPLQHIEDETKGPHELDDDFDTGAILLTRQSLNTDSEYLVLTDDTELNCTKPKFGKGASHGLGESVDLTYPSRSDSRFRWAVPFANFYKAENNSLNVGPSENLNTWGTGGHQPIRPPPPPPPPPHPPTPSRSPPPPPPSPPQNDGSSSQFQPSVINKSPLNPKDDPEEPDKDILLVRRKVHENHKTIAIWALIVGMIVLLCIFIPLTVVYARGTDDTVKSYLSNIKPEHRAQLLDSYLTSMGLTVSTNATSSTDASKSLSKGYSRVKKVGQSNRPSKPPSEGGIRGGLRNSKFKTKSIAGETKFSQIPLHFQKSQELKRAMNNKKLRNVFYGLDYAPKHVIYPECGSTMSEVMVDVALLSQVTSRIRTYGTQCNQTRNILESIRLLNLNVSLSAGVWIGANEENNQRQIDDLKLVLHEYPREYFESIFVGNEVLFRDDQPAHRLIQYIQQVKSLVQIEMNWDLPVGTSDVGYRTDPSVLNACDFYGSNTHPFFQGDSVQSATQWVFDYMQYQIEPFKHLAVTESKIPKVMISEVGWPSGGGSFKNSTAGTEQLQQFLDEWICKANNYKHPWYFFEAFDEPWKQVYHRQEATWETHWGLFTDDRRLKEGITLPNCSITTYE